MRAITVVVVLVPIPFGVPSLSVFIPPAVAVFPAPFPRSDECPALFLCLGTVPAVLLSGPVQLMIDVNDSLLAVLLIGTRMRRAKQDGRAGQRNSDK